MSLPRLLRGAGTEPMDFATHCRIHGDPPTAAGGGGAVAGPRLLAELGLAGLRGCGGGAFPLAAKLEAAMGGRRRPIVVVNATEGEPMSVKDRMLLELLPHLILDGALCLADTLGTAEVIIAIDESFDDATESIRRAVDERPDIGRRSAQAKIVRVPSGYVTGQETAIVNFINHGIPRPVTQPPRLTERGIAKRPTLMSNAETLAHVALIARHGAEWFRRLGSHDEPGSVLVTLSGGVRAPGYSK